MSTAALPLYQQVEGFFWNAATGTLTQAQKDALIAQEVAGVTRASGGSGDPSQIAAQAESDVTATLILNKADPSQASIFSPGLDAVVQKAGWVIAIVAVAALIYFAIEAYFAFR